MKQDALRRLWPERLGKTLQLVACAGLFANVVMVVSASTQRSYRLGNLCGWDAVFQSMFIGLEYFVYLPLLAFGRMFLGYWGPLTMVWLGAASYLAVQHVLLLYATCGVERLQG